MVEVLERVRGLKGAGIWMLEVCGVNGTICCLQVQVWALAVVDVLVQVELCVVTGGICAEWRK